MQTLTMEIKVERRESGFGVGGSVQEKGHAFGFGTPCTLKREEIEGVIEWNLRPETWGLQGSPVRIVPKLIQDDRAKQTTLLGVAEQAGV